MHIRHITNYHSTPSWPKANISTSYCHFNAGNSVYAGVHFTDLRRIDNWENFSGNRGHAESNPVHGRGFNLGPLGWDTTAPTPPLCKRVDCIIGDDLLIIIRIWLVLHCQILMNHPTSASFIWAIVFRNNCQVINAFWLCFILRIGKILEDLDILAGTVDAPLCLSFFSCRISF